MRIISVAVEIKVTRGDVCLVSEYLVNWRLLKHGPMSVKGKWRVSKSKSQLGPVRVANSVFRKIRNVSSLNVIALVKSLETAGNTGSVFMTTAGVERSVVRDQST